MDMWEVKRKTYGSIPRRNWLENSTRNILNTVWSAGLDVRGALEISCFDRPKKLVDTNRIVLLQATLLQILQSDAALQARPQKPSDRYSDLSHFSIVQPRQFVRGRVHRSSKLLSSLRHLFFFASPICSSSSAGWPSKKKMWNGKKREKKNKKNSPTAQICI